MRIIFLLFFLFFTCKCFSQQTELIVQTGNPGSVYSVDISSDLKFIASACSDGMVRLFDFKTGFQLHMLRGHTREAVSSHFSKNGKYLVSSGGYQHILWDATSGKKIMTVEQESQQVSTSVISADEQYFYGDWEGGQIIQIPFAAMFRTDNENAIREDSSIWFDNTIESKIFEGHKAPVKLLAVSHNSKYLVSADVDSIIILRDAVSGNILHTINPGKNSTAITFSASDKELVVLNDDQDKSGITFYDVASGKVKRFIKDKTDKSQVVVCTPDGKYFAVGYLLNTIKLYDYVSGKLIKTFAGHTSWINSLASDASSNYLVSAGEDKAIKLWDIQNGTIVSSIAKNIQEINRVSFDDEHKLIAIETEENYQNKIRIWNLEKGNGFSQIFSIKWLSNLGYSLKMNNSGTKVMANGDSGIYVWDPVIAKLLDHISTKKPGKAAMHNNLIAFEDFITGLNLYDLTTKKITILDSIHKKTISSIDFSSDGSLLSVAEIGPNTEIWDIKTKKLLYTLNYTDPDNTDDEADKKFFGDNAWVYDAKFSPDNKLLATATRTPDPIVSGSNINIWDAVTGKYLKGVVAGGFPIQSLNWSPDGKKIVIGTNGRELAVWDVAAILNRQNSQQPDADTTIDNDYTIMSAAYTKDAKWLITGGIDGKLIIRDAKTLSLIATIVVIDSVNYVIATPDNYYAASKNAVTSIAFKQGNKIFPFQQFDLQYNRPDIVMERLGIASPDLIKGYKSAYLKRLKKVGFTEEMFNKDFHLPEIKIAGKLPFTTIAKEVVVQLHATDTKYNLDRLEILNNGVPLYGKSGISLRDKKVRSAKNTINVQLTPGKNKIEALVLNDKGVESLREIFYINYNPPAMVPSKMYFIGIGVNRYKDSSMNLKYAAKDIRDLATIFAAKYPGSSIDTFINEAATAENILAVKQKLLKTSPNDKVVISASGHGVLDKKLNFYFATHNMDFKNPASKGLLYDDFEDLLDAIPALKKILLLDACHSGEVDREEKVILRDSLASNLKIFATKGAGEQETAGIGLQNTFELMKELFSDLSKGNGAVVISAAGGFEFALEGDKYNNGVFTYCIKQAMELAKPLTVYQLKDYVSRQVEKLTSGKQRPTSRKENMEFDWSF